MKKIQYISILKKNLGLKLIGLKLIEYLNFIMKLKNMMMMVTIQMINILLPIQNSSEN